LIRLGQAACEFDGQFDSKKLAFGIYGHLSTYSLAYWLMPDCKLDRQRVERIIELFLADAGPKSGLEPEEP